MSRKVKETEHIYLYKDNQNELQIAFKHKDFTSVYYLNVGDGVMQEHKCFSVCDSCNKKTKKFYLPPELGLKSYCDDCFIDYKRRAKWHQEDMTFIFDTIIQIVLNPKFALIEEYFTDEELDIIDLYFEEHSNHPPKIRYFIEKYKEGYKDVYSNS